MQSKDQEIQQLKTTVSNLQQHLDTQTYVTDDASKVSCNQLAYTAIPQYMLVLAKKQTIVEKWVTI